MELKRACFALVLVVIVLFSSQVFAGDIVHQDDVAPKKPGCENNFVLVKSLFFLFLFLDSFFIFSVNFLAEYDSEVLVEES